MAAVGIEVSEFSIIASYWGVAGYFEFGGESKRSRRVPVMSEVRERTLALAE